MSEPKSNAERQQSFRDRKKEKQREEIRSSLDGAPDHVLAIAAEDWGPGYEARCILRTEKYAKKLLYVHQTGVLIQDSDGYYNSLASREGRRSLAELMDEQRQEFYDYLRTHLLEEQWLSSKFDLARRRLRYPTHQTILEVANTIESVNAIKGSKIEECESSDLNNHKLILLQNGTIDVGMMPVKLLTVEEVAEKKSLRPKEKGKASFIEQAHYEDNGDVDKLAELVSTHSTALRYLWWMLVSGGDKQAGYLRATQSNAGKSTMASVLQEMTGQVAIADRRIMQSGSRFNNLELLMTRYLLVIIDEADKLDNITPHFINSAVNSGMVQLEEKFALPIMVKRKGNLCLVAGGDVQIDWQSQGIIPDENGNGGRFKSMVSIDGVMDDELGKFLNDSTMANQRPGFLTALLAYLTDPDQQWTEEKQQEARETLMSEVGNAYLDWQIALMDEYQQGEDNQHITSKDIKETIDDAVTKPPSDKAVKQFIESKFGATKMRLPRNLGRGMAWWGLTMLNKESDTYEDL